MTPVTKLRWHRTCLACWMAGILLLSGCSTISNEASHLMTVLTPSKPKAQPVAVTSAEVPLPPEWLTIESTVVSLGEQDLLTRMQMGFQLTDLDHRAIDVEEKWFASHPDYLDRTFRRGERYLYYIVSELEARNMPLELALLPVVESAYNPTAYSRAKAAGLWQFIPSTGTRFGLKQNLYYDGRRDVVEATRAALDYLEFLRDEFNGDWLLAIAAYNSGEMNVTRAVQRNLAKGKPTDFFSLDLPRETEAYVPKLLAMRRIVDNPQKHGLAFGSMANQPYFVKVDVGGQIDLNVAAQMAGMTREDFLAINPGFKRSITDPTGPHQLLIPVENEKAFLDQLAAMPESERVPVVYYRVRKGDTLSKIAARYGMSVAELRDLNRITGKTVKPGQELLLRGVKQNDMAKLIEQTTEQPAKSSSAKTGAGQTYVVRSGDTVWSIAQRFNVDPSVIIALNDLKGNAIQAGQKLRISKTLINTNTQTASKASQEQVTYTVRRGDTLEDIAGQFRVGVKQIMAWNNLRSASMIKAGQRLVIYMDDSRRSGG